MTAVHGGTVNGTLHVLRACAQAGTVSRVVMTSSISAISEGWELPPKNGDTVMDPESKWSNPGKCTPYRKLLVYTASRSVFSDALHGFAPLLSREVA
jgi:nucleoside-diphosphate-sugar epimerase